MVLEAVACGVLLRPPGQAAAVEKLFLGPFSALDHQHLHHLLELFPRLRTLSAKNCSHLSDNLAIVLQRHASRASDDWQPSSDSQSSYSSGITSLTLERAHELTSAGIRALFPVAGRGKGNLQTLSLPHHGKLVRLVLLPPISCQLRSLHLSCCPKLETATLSFHHLTSLRMNECARLVTLNLTVPALKELKLAKCSIDSLVVGNLANLTALHLTGTKWPSRQWEALVASPHLAHADMGRGSPWMDGHRESYSAIIPSLILTHVISAVPLPQLVIPSPRLSHVKLTGSVLLEELRISATQLEVLDLRNTPLLTRLDVSDELLQKAKKKDRRIAHLWLGKGLVASMRTALSRASVVTHCG